MYKTFDGTCMDWKGQSPIPKSINQLVSQSVGRWLVLRIVPTIPGLLHVPMPPTGKPRGPVGPEYFPRQRAWVRAISLECWGQFCNSIILWHCGLCLYLHEKFNQDVRVSPPSLSWNNYSKLAKIAQKVGCLAGIGTATLLMFSRSANFHDIW